MARSTDIRVRFADQLNKLKEWGYIERDDELITVTRNGLLQIDVLLHDFFLPQHRNTRYA